MVVVAYAGTAETTANAVACAVAGAKFVRMTPIGNHTDRSPVKGN